MVNVEYDSVKKKYGDEIAIEDINLEVEDGEFAILLGPSGCGKTTTLRCLAGLTEPTEGTIKLEGHDITDIHPKNRNIAMVFQNFALYPHMTVRENISYPLKVEGVDASEREERVQEVAEMLEIPELLDRDIANLSGGQQQRVALGRAIIRRPLVFLMDEPLANLDAKLKMSMRSRIKVLQREMGITTLYVTHDQEEAMSLGDKLIIMDDGHIQQIGSPDEVYHYPENQFVAGFIGSPGMNFLTVERDGNRIRSTVVPDHFDVELEETVADRYRDYEEFTLGVRPAYFTVHTSPAENTIPGIVEVTEPQGNEQIVDVIVGDPDGTHESIRTVAPSSVDTGRNEDVWLEIDDTVVHGFDPDTGDRIAPGEEVDRETAESRTGAQLQS